MQISRAFFKKKSSYSSNLRGFVPLFLLCACCLAQSCADVWFRFFSFPLPCTLSSCHDWALSVCNDSLTTVNCGRQTVCLIGRDFFFFFIWRFVWELELIVYFHIAVLLQSKMPFRLRLPPGKTMRKAWVHVPCATQSAPKREVATARTKPTLIPQYMLGQMPGCGRFP